MKMGLLSQWLKVRSAAALVLVLLLVAACAPASDPGRVAIAQLSEEVSYYPHQTGIIWQFLPNNAALNEQRIYQQVLGPTVIDGDLWIASQLAGRGLEVFTYRQYRDDGVFILKEVKPGAEIVFDPPIQEFPPEGTLRVGSTWSGDTTVQGYFPEARPEEQRQTWKVNYNYTVVDQRPVTVQSGTFDVFVINFTSRNITESGEVLEELTQETWFSPYVGEVKTENDYYLVESNFLIASQP